jgi:hypothetical protein
MMRFLFIVLLTLQGVAMAGMRHGTAVALNGKLVAQLTRYEHEFFPLMSVVKLPLAVVVLHHVEQGKLRLEEHGGGYGTEYLEPHAKAFSEGRLFFSGIPLAGLIVRER